MLTHHVVVVVASAVPPLLDVAPCQSLHGPVGPSIVIGYLVNMASVIPVLLRPRADIVEVGVEGVSSGKDEDEVLGTCEPMKTARRTDGCSRKIKGGSQVP